MKNVNTEKNIPAIVDDVIITINDQKYEIKGNNELKVADLINLKGMATKVDSEFVDLEKDVSDSIKNLISEVYHKNIITRETAVKYFNAFTINGFDEMEMAALSKELYFARVSEESAVSMLYNNFRSLDMTLQFMQIIKEVINAGQPITKDITVTSGDKGFTIKANRELDTVNAILHTDMSFTAMGQLIKACLNIEKRCETFIHDLYSMGAINNTDLEYYYGFLYTRLELSTINRAYDQIRAHEMNKDTVEAGLLLVGRYIDFALQITDAI